MKRIFCGVLAAALLCLGLGCSSDKDKGINSNKEKPKAEWRTPTHVLPRAV